MDGMASPSIPAPSSIDGGASMSPSPDAVRAINARVDALKLLWSQQSDGQILAALNADMQPNPNPAAIVAAPFRATDLLSVLASDPTKIHTLIHSPAFVGTIRPLLDAPDPKTPDQVRQIGEWVQGLSAAGDLTTDEAQAIQTMIARTNPDPSYRATVPVIEGQLGRPLDLDDVASSRPGG